MKVEEKGNFLILKIEQKKLGVENIVSVKKSIIEAMNTPKNYIVVDFSQVEYLDSSGMGMLLSIQKKSQGKELRLCGLNSTVLNLLKLTKLDTIFKIYNSVDEATK
jgi:anti-sigma B factor antagonist